MSREIKFRAWNETRNKMFFQGKDFEELSLIDGEYKPVLNNSIENAFNWYKEKTILMQDTGLKDKNNKGICEGDIVLFDYIPYEVYQHECGDWRAGGKIIWEWIGDDATENEWEVIGNIYENKELLE